MGCCLQAEIAHFAESIVCVCVCGFYSAFAFYGLLKILLVCVWASLGPDYRMSGMQNNVEFRMGLFRGGRMYNEMGWNEIDFTWANGFLFCSFCVLRIIKFMVRRHMQKPATCSLRSQYSPAADAVQMFDFLARVHNCPCSGQYLVVLVVTG